MYTDKEKKSARIRFICVYPCAICACFGKSLSSYGVSHFSWSKTPSSTRLMEVWDARKQDWEVGDDHRFGHQVKQFL